MIKHMKPLPISEEMLGAYFEGNLSQHDARYVEQMLQCNDELSAFVGELSMSDNLSSNYLMEDIPSFENDFTLPEISTGIDVYIESHDLPFEFEPSLSDIAAFAIIPDIADDGDIIISQDMRNVDISETLNNGIDINSENLPNEGEL